MPCEPSSALVSSIFGMTVSISGSLCPSRSVPLMPRVTPNLAMESHETFSTGIGVCVFIYLPTRCPYGQRRVFIHDLLLSPTPGSQTVARLSPAALNAPPHWYRCLMLTPIDASFSCIFCKNSLKVRPSAVLKQDCPVSQLHF